MAHPLTLFLTPTQHLGQVLLDQMLPAAASTVQATPAVLAFSTFLRKTYDALIQKTPHTPHPILLNATQAFFLWHQTFYAYSRVSLPRLQKAFQAWQLCTHWDIPLEASEFTQTPMTHHFQQAAMRFQAQLHQHHALAEPQLLSYLMQFPFPLAYKRIIFKCFDELSPQQHQFRRYLETQEIEVIDQEISAFPAFSKAPQCHLVVAEETFDENQALLAWLHQKRAQALTPLAIVVPNLAEQAPSLTRWLHTHFPADPLAISLGMPLIQYPLIQQALAILRLERLDLPAASPGQWVPHFYHRLSTHQWPGESLTSEAYQSVQRFLSLLDDFKTLTFLHAHMTPLQALTTLERLTQTTLFQPQQSLQAPLHVLGLLDAAGSSFPAMWIMGLTDQAFPSIAAANPFIPPTLQQAYTLPATDLAHIEATARRRLQRFQHACPELILSYAQHSGDQRNRPSPLITHFPRYTPSTSSLPRQLATCETLLQPTKIPLTPRECIPRGSHLLSEQAHCPFRAFARYRLRALPSDLEENRYASKARGIALHQALENVWRQLRSQKQLLSLKETDLDALLSASLAPLDSLLKNLPSALHALEKNRLKQLLLAALAQDKKRPDFSVYALEAACTLPLGPMTFHIKIDRIDQLNAETHWVIDYKTHFPSPLPWQQDTPRHPQLLLYALHSPRHRAILFHALQKGRAQLKGVGENATKAPFLETSPDWDAQRTQWHAYLTQLAMAFSQGECAPRPQQPSICQACEFRRLCRAL